MWFSIECVCIHEYFRLVLCWEVLSSFIVSSIGVFYILYALVYLQLMVCLLEWYEQADSQLVKNSILGALIYTACSIWC